MSESTYDSDFLRQDGAGGRGGEGLQWDVSDEDTGEAWASSQGDVVLVGRNPTTKRFNGLLLFDVSDLLAQNIVVSDITLSLTTFPFFAWFQSIPAPVFDGPPEFTIWISWNSWGQEYQLSMLHDIRDFAVSKVTATIDVSSITSAGGVTYDFTLPTSIYDPDEALFGDLLINMEIRDTSTFVSGWRQYAFGAGAVSTTIPKLTITYDVAVDADTVCPVNGSQRRVHSVTGSQMRTHAVGGAQRRDHDASGSQHRTHSGVGSQRRDHAATGEIGCGD